MHKREIFTAIENAMKEAKKKHPDWPEHIAAQAGIVSAKSGSLMKCSLNWKYDKDFFDSRQRQAIKKEAIETIAAAIRLLENLKD